MLRRKQAGSKSRHAGARKLPVRIHRHRTPVREGIVNEEHVAGPESGRGYDELDAISVGYSIELLDDVPIDPLARR